LLAYKYKYHVVWNQARKKEEEEARDGGGRHAFGII
jgi:hypothetical protein